MLYFTAKRYMLNAILRIQFNHKHLVCD